MIKFYGNKHLRVTRATCHEAAKKALQSNETRPALRRPPSRLQ
jgi:hypothetical protein